jgi:hypothetical protein
MQKSPLGLISSVWIFLCFTGCGLPKGSATNPVVQYNGPGVGNISKTVSLALAKPLNGFVMNAANSVHSPNFTLTLSGSFLQLYGFHQLSATNSSDLSNVTTGKSLYGFEVPSFAFFLAPFDLTSLDQSFWLMPGSACPGSDVNTNWVNFRPNPLISGTQTLAFGTFAYQLAKSMPQILTAYKLEETSSQSSQNFPVSACSQGKVQVSNSVTGDQALFYFSAAGSMVMNTAMGNANTGELYVGFPVQTLNLTLFTASSSKWVGFLYQASRPVGYRVVPVAGLVKGTSQLSVSLSVLWDVSTGTIGTESLSANFSQLNYPSAGFVQGQLALQNSSFATASSVDITCMTQYQRGDSLQNLLVCAAVDPGNSAGWFSLWLASTGS